MSIDSTTISPSSYHRVREWIDNYCSKQNLEPGARIPSERTLAGELGLSRPTIARAILRLTKEGVLVREERSGTFINSHSFTRQASSNTYTIGIVMPWLSQTPPNANGEIAFKPPPSKRTLVPHGNIDSFFQIAFGAFSVLQEFNCHISLQSNGTLEEEYESLTQLASKGIDGVIVMPGFTLENIGRYNALVSSGIPIVFIDHYFPEIAADRVATDNFAGARDAVRHLISLGHRRIAHFTDFVDVTTILDREAGYCAALKEAGIPIDEDIIRGPEPTRDHRQVYNFALKYCLSMPDPITAVFCVNDNAILATQISANYCEISIPDDLEVAGFYDDTPEVMPAPFTRVVQPKLEMGRKAAQLLIDRITGKAPAQPQHIAIPAEIITRI